MTRTVRARRAERANQPLYARALRLRHLAPSGLLCFVFLEGAVVLGILLALAELVSWWGVIVLPVTVALMVKFNDLVAGALTPRPAGTETTSARATVLRPAIMQGHAQDAPTSGYAPPVPSGYIPSGNVSSGAPTTVPADRPAGYGSEDTLPTERTDAEWARSSHADVAGAVPRDPQRAAGFRVAVSRSTTWNSGPAMPARPARPAGPALPARPAMPARSAMPTRSAMPARPAGPTVPARPATSSGAATERAGDFGPAVVPMAEHSGGYATAASPFVDQPGGYAVAGSPFVEQSSGYAMVDLPSIEQPGGYAAVGSPLAETVDGYLPAVSQEPSAVGCGADDMTGAPAVGYPGSYTQGVSRNEYSQFTRDTYDGESAGDVPDSSDFRSRSGEESRGEDGSTRRPWADQLDVRQQMARQAASRRYE